MTSRDADVDPVGACVGMKGSRVQAVVQELRGEKIDIVPFDRDPARYVIAAIQPAEVHKVIVDEADGRMELVVPDEKLSLAIGRKGQNVRLAAQLTELEARHHQRDQVQADGRGGDLRLAADGRGDEQIAKSMYRLGFRALEEVSEASVEELGGIPGVGGAEAAERIKSQARTRRWSGCGRSASARASSRTEPLTDRERLMFVRGVGDRTVVLLEEAGLPQRRGRAARGRGSARDPHRPRHQEGARHQAGARDFVESEQKVLDAARADVRRAVEARHA